MSIKYGKFEMPKKIKVEEGVSNTFGRFIAEPFERGYGHTVGNAMRRILLSSLEAPSIISLRIEGVPHEYTAIEGVIEDMINIILNFKGILLRKHVAEEEVAGRAPKMVTKTLDIGDAELSKAKGAYKVTAKDLIEGSDFELINPDHYLFTITKPLKKRVDIKIGVGRGYVPSERHDIEKMADEIIIDSAFSPVRLVNYYVENTRVGQDTDYDSLILEVSTDGRITPQEAITFAAQIGVQHLQVFDYLKTHTLVFDKEVIEANKEKEELMKKLVLKINEIELSVRSTNCLASADISTIGELVLKSEAEMLKFRNFGKKSLLEIRQKLEEMGLGLGMDLSKYGITPENVKTVIQNYLEKMHGEEHETL